MKSRTAAIITSRQKTVLMLSVAVFALAVVLSGCRAEEQGRVLRYTPGVYKGKPDTNLKADQLRVLDYRIALQSGVAAKTGGAPKRSGDVRAPKSSNTMDWKALDMRLEKQKAEPVKK